MTRRPWTRPGRPSSTTSVRRSRRPDTSCLKHVFISKQKPFDQRSSDGCGQDPGILPTNWLSTVRCTNAQAK